MARGRMLSKNISLDEKVDALSDDTARLLFTWLIAHLDVEGRMYGDARLFTSIVAPRRNYSLKKVEKYLIEMESLGLILRYSVNGHTYLCAPHFEKHQVGLRKDKEAQSQIPTPPTDLLRSKSVFSPSLLPPKRSIKEKKLKRIEKNKETNKEKNFDIFWKAYPRKRAKGQAEKAFDKINPDEPLLARLLKAVGEQAKTQDWQKDGGKFIPYPATWLNGKYWEDGFNPIKEAVVSGAGHIPTAEELDREVRR